MTLLTAVLIAAALAVVAAAVVAAAPRPRLLPVRRDPTPRERAALLRERAEVERR